MARSEPELPQPTGSPYRIALVCLGNICRSPMAQVTLAETLERAGMADRVEVNSAGTGHWHVGEPMDERAASTLLAEGYDPSAHRARQYDASWSSHDLILCMDRSNLDDVRRLTPPDRHDRVRLFRDFDPVSDGEDDTDDVPDPYYGADTGFAEVLVMVERTARTLTDLLARLLSGPTGPVAGTSDRT